MDMHSDVINRTRDLIKILQSADNSPYIGEPVSQLEHALQSAFFARKRFNSTTITLSALLHDIGHLVANGHGQMDNLGTLEHEVIGARYLESLGFSDAVCHLVQSHVLAKRYLCFRKKGYHQGLSPASEQTLMWQGGPMNHDEAMRFEDDPWFETILALRMIDERAKDPTLTVPGLTDYAPLIEEHLAKNIRGGEYVIG